VKFLIVGDVHWSEKSSILNSVGEKYSTRLEWLQKSIKWVHELEKQYKAQVVQLGDFFDRDFITGNEVAALDEVSHCVKDWFAVLGNHEMDIKGNTLQALKCSKVFSEIEYTDHKSVDIVYLPYSKTPENFKTTFDETIKTLVFSHNDVKGVNFGNGIISTSGIDPKNLSKNTLMFNGHLHNGGKIGNIVNVGNLTGQNFTESSIKHSIILFDLDTWAYEEIENPYAIGFAQVTLKQAEKIEDCSNLVLSIKCKDTELDRYQVIKESCLAAKPIIEYKTKDMPASIEEVNNSQDFSHFEKYLNWVQKRFEDEPIVVKMAKETLC